MTNKFKFPVQRAVRNRCSVWMQTYGISSSSFGLGALNRANAAISQALERLSTGSRINRASDDPSGMAAMSALEFELSSLEGTIAGKERTNLRLAAKEGAMSVMSDLLIELEGLIVQASSDGWSPAEREAMQVQADSILGAMDTLRYTSRFEGYLLLEGFSPNELGGVMVEVPSDDPDAPPESRQASLASLKTGGLLNLVDGDLEAAMQAAEGARSYIARTRGAIGAEQQSIASELDEMRIRFENLSGMASDIGDADMAAEVSELVRGQILQQASIQTILIRRQSAESTLALLSGVTGQPTAPLGL